MTTAAAGAAKRRRRAYAPGKVPGGWCSRCGLCGPEGECLDGVKGFKSGRCGDWVWYVVNGQQWRRHWVSPFDPKTSRQQAWRARVAEASKAYSGRLTDEEQDACIAEGAKRQTRKRLGQSGPETGHQWWMSQKLREKQSSLRPKEGKPKS